MATGKKNHRKRNPRRLLKRPPGRPPPNIRQLKPRRPGPESTARCAAVKIIYYDDEELDRFAGRSGDDYTDEEIEEFQEVLMTLRPEDALGWSRSVEQRHITLPADVRDGLMLLITEG